MTYEYAKSHLTSELGSSINRRIKDNGTVACNFLVNSGLSGSIASDCKSLTKIIF